MALHQKRKPIIHVESPLAPKPGDPGWPKHLAADDSSPDAAHGGVTCKEAAFHANTEFVKGCCRAIALAGGIPQAPHLFFPLFLNDFDAEERAIGLEAGIQSQRIADEVWFCLPAWREEFSSGMQDGQTRALALNLPCVMAQSVIPMQHGNTRYASKFDYHLSRLIAGNYDLRHRGA